MGVQPFTFIYQTVAGYAASFNVKSALSNPATIVTAAVPTIAVAGTLIDKLNSAKKQAQQTATSATTQINGLQNQLGNATDKLSTTNLSLDSANQQITTLQAKAEGATSQVEQLQKQIENLSAQNEQLSKMMEARPVQIIKETTVL